MRDVFLSYAHEDRETAEQLASQLVAAGLTVWWDIELRPGDDFPQQIERVLGQAGCVVVLWSRHSVAAGWVRAEATEGLERGKLIPLTLDGSQPPLVFRNLHTASWQEIVAGEVAWSKFVETIRTRLDKPSEGETVAVPPRDRHPRRRRKTLTRKQLLAVFAGLFAVSAFGIAVLEAFHKSTVVELQLKLDEIGLTVLPALAPTEVGTDDLLAPDLQVHVLQWRGAESFEATLAEPRPGRVTAEPRDSNTIALHAAADTPAFSPSVRLRRPMRLKLVASGRDRVTVTVAPLSELVARSLGIDGAPGPGDWRCEVPARDNLELRLRGVELVVDSESLLDPVTRLEPRATAIVFRGGGRRAELGLMLSFRSRALEDLGAGELLAPSLKVLAPSFYRFEKTLLEKSFILGGRVLFHGRARAPVELERESLLRVPEEATLTLRSLRLAGGDLELVLLGELKSVEFGPTLAHMEELLPSLFVWLATHQLPTLIFSALTVLVVTALSLLKLLGLLKRD